MYYMSSHQMLLDGEVNGGGPRIDIQPGAILLLWAMKHENHL